MHDAVAEHMYIIYTYIYILLKTRTTFALMEKWSLYKQIWPLTL